MRHLSPDPGGIASAAEILRSGGLLGLPTETVYGLAADAGSDAAVAAIYAAKGRPAGNPLIVHVADAAAAWRVGVPDARARALAASFWPGPLTLVVPLAPGHGLAAAVTAGLPTVALRVPGHPVAQSVLAAFGGPVAAPSANPSGRVSPTRAAHLADLGAAVAAVVDAGPCPVGLESTIVRTDPPAILREGGLDAAAVEAVAGPMSRDLTPGRVAAPGQLRRHYAPGLPLVLDAATAPADAVLVGFGPVAGDLTLSASGDLAEAAARLYATLREAADLARRSGRGRIAIAPIPTEGLGAAIQDRLRRAAA